MHWRSYSLASGPDWKMIAAAGFVMAATTVAGCGSSTQPANESSAAASWTTLGTRASASQPGISITSNADAQWSDYDPPAQYQGVAEQPVQFITMPDGTQLAAYVTLPADSNGDAATGPFPAILIQTSYNGFLSETQLPVISTLSQGADPYMVEHGYATVLVDVRGTGQSTGSWQAIGPQEQADYGNVVDWVTQQPWSNGSIAVFGASYLSFTAILTASQNHPAVKAAFPVVPLGDAYRDIVFTGGQLDPVFIPFWLNEVTVLGLIDPALLTDPTEGVMAVVDHVVSYLAQFQLPLLLGGITGVPDVAYDGSFWSVRSPLEVDSNIRIPTFVVGGLEDLFQRGEPLTYEEIKTHAPAKLLIGPWTHLQACNGEGLPVDGVPALDHIELRWFDQYVKGLQVGADTLPNVTQYVIGYGHYVTATDWPHPRVQAERLFLHGDKSLSAVAPVPGEASNQIIQEPIEGLCSISTSQWTFGLAGMIPLPCFSNDNTTELLDAKYQTGPMTENFYINGPIEVDVWMSTTAGDAGLSVRVDDVAPDGTATPLANGIQTASLRAVDTTRSRMMNGMMLQPWHPYTEASEEPLTPDTPVLVPVEIFPTSAMIATGHSLRIAVGASDLPQGVPPLPTLLQSLIGAITIYSDSEHQSGAIIPVVPVSALN